MKNSESWHWSFGRSSGDSSAHFTRVTPWDIFPRTAAFQARVEMFSGGCWRGCQESVSTGTISVERFLKEGDQLREVDRRTWPSISPSLRVPIPASAHWRPRREAEFLWSWGHLLCRGRTEILMWLHMCCWLHVTKSLLWVQLSWQKAVFSFRVLCWWFLI